jgi:uncharacterized membrane protein (UPF0127 family)
VRLLRDGREVAAVEVAATARARTRGLLGRDGIEGGLLLRPANSVHSFGMRFDLDVAFLDRDGVVLRTVRLPRQRMTRVVLGARSVLEAEAGAFEAWGLRVGDRLLIAPA